MTTVVFSTWYVLRYGIKQPTSNQKMICSLLSGIIFALVWVLLFHKEMEIIITSFFASIVIYSWVIKKLMKKLDIDYNDENVKLW
jgi:hypothetical protein